MLRRLSANLAGVVGRHRRAGRTRVEAKSSTELLAWADVIVSGLRHGAQHCRLVSGRTAGSL
jgi:hypothetical protein